jgi:hypothetical protein
VTSFKALILPADDPPSHAAVKRQLLFFDSVLLVDPQSDRAILNQGDLAPERGLKVTMPDGVTRAADFGYGDAGTYPRSPSYVEAHRVLFAQTSQLQSKGKVRILKALPPSVVDPRFNWLSSVQASHDAALVRSALPDYRAGTPAFYRLVGGWYQAPPLLSQTGEEPKQHKWIHSANHYEDPDLDIEWNQVGWVRIGRLLKTLRRATHESAVPIAIDPINRNICLELVPAASRAPASDPYPRLTTGATDLAMQAIAMDLVDPFALDDALRDMAWDQVVRLRKEVLPHVSKLRQALLGDVASARLSLTAGVDEYRQALSVRKDEQRRQVDIVREAWRKLGFKTAEVTAGVAVGAVGRELAVGLHALPVAWVPALVAFAGAFLGKMLPGSFENASKAISAYRKMRASPLFFFDVLPGRARKSATDGAAA